MFKICLVLGMASTAAATAGFLWDQSDYDPNVLRAVGDQELPDIPYLSGYDVSDVLTDPAGWRIQSISTYFTQGLGHWAGVTQARLNIFPKTGALPPLGDDPRTGAVVPVSLRDLGGTGWEITAEGLDLALSGAAAYWIGLTPIAAYGQYGQELHWSACSVVGDESAQWYVSGFESHWVLLSEFLGAPADNAIKIEGELLPEPAAGALIAMAALASRPRRW